MLTIGVGGLALCSMTGTASYRWPLPLCGWGHRSSSCTPYGYEGFLLLFLLKGSMDGAVLLRLCWLFLKLAVLFPACVSDQVSRSEIVCALPFGCIHFGLSGAHLGEGCGFSSWLFWCFFAPNKVLLQQKMCCCHSVVSSFHPFLLILTGCLCQLSYSFVSCTCGFFPPDINVMLSKVPKLARVQTVAQRACLTLRDPLNIVGWGLCFPFLGECMAETQKVAGGRFQPLAFEPCCLGVHRRTPQFLMNMGMWLRLVKAELHGMLGRVRALLYPWQQGASWPNTQLP